MSCPNCFRGGVSGAEPTGTEMTIHGVPTYVAQPAEGVIPKGLVVVIPDAFGWDFVNNRVLCDNYAKKGGFLVYLPDFMNGYSMDGSAIALMDHIMEPAPTWGSFLAKPFSVLQAMILGVPWFIRTRMAVTWPLTVAYFQALRTSPPPFETPSGTLRIGTAGFCWGGKRVVLLAHDDPATRVVRHEAQAGGSNEPQRLIDAAFTAHPSLLVLPGDAMNIKVPTSVVVGDVDAVLKADDAKKMKSILDAMDVHEMRIEPGAKHGFAIRTHPGDKHEVECADRAEEQAISWFTKAFMST